jgi:Type II CAAX prenyl endopeptidase Rce1-like
MSHWVPYVSLAVFPLLVFFPFNIVAFSWGFRHGTQPMPAELASRSKIIDQYVREFSDALLLLVVTSLAIQHSVPFSRIGLRLTGWQWNLAIGLGASVLQIALEGLAWRFFPPGEGFLGDKRLIEGSASQWAFSNLLSVLAEEFWIAFCVITLRQTGHSILTSVALTASVFAATHFQYRLGAIATGLYGAIFASLFLWRGSLLPSYLMHYIGNVGALFWARRPRLWKKVQSMPYPG